MGDNDDSVPAPVANFGMSNENMDKVNCLLNEDSEEDDIDCNIDDALDEGYMALQGTLERGFSLQESPDDTNENAVKYKEFKIDYQHEPSFFKRYLPTLKHLIPVRREKCEEREMPIDKTGMINYTLFSWMSPLMWRAYKTGLTADTIPLCSKYEMCDYNAQRLEKLWDEELKKYGPDKAKLSRVVWLFIRTRVFFGLCLFIISLGLGFAGPTLFMRYLIDWLSGSEPISQGVIWTVALVCMDLFRILTFGLVWAVNYRTGVRLRAACLGLVYKKLMKLSALGDKSVGEMINLFANDGQRIFDFVVLGVLIVGGPVVAIGGVAYILWLLGPYALSGMLAFLVFYPVQYGISRLTGLFRRRTVRVTDERVSLMNELLVCIKLIKMYAWEGSFSSAIEDVRGREKVLLEKSAYVQSVSLAMSPTVPVIAAIVTFVAHIAAGNDLSPAQCYSLIAMMSGPLRLGLQHLRFSEFVALALVSFRRLQATSFMGLLGLIHFGLDCVAHCVLPVVHGQIAVRRVQAYSVWSMLRNIGFTIFILPHTVRALVEWSSSSDRIQAMSVMGLFLRTARSSISCVRMGTRAIVEADSTWLRVQAMSVVSLCAGQLRQSLILIPVGLKSIVDGFVTFLRVQTFSFISFCARVRGMLHYVPLFGNAYPLAMSALTRLQSVLQLPELEDYVKKNSECPEVTIEMTKASLAWPVYTDPSANLKKRKISVSPAEQLLLHQKGYKDDCVTVLHNITFSAKKGELIGVCGSVGSGKSSLLYGLLGQMQLIKNKDGERGTVAVAGSVAYVGQQAWILNTSIRENILLGEEFDALRYFRVIYACSLTQDLDALPAGDLTEVGERGINLSGGQKQRISLARALYSKRDVYLLDDPLSAVDPEVGRHLFKWAIKTALKNSTVLLVTHQLQYLPECTKVILIQSGGITEQGTHDQLFRNENEYFNLYCSHKKTTLASNESDSSPTPVRKRLLSQRLSNDFLNKQRKRTISMTSTGSVSYNGNVAIGGVTALDMQPEISGEDYSQEVDVSVSSEQQSSLLSSPTEDDEAKARGILKQPNKSKGNLMSEERVQSGNVASNTYISYIRAAGGFFVAIGVVLAFGINVGTTAFSSWWLSHWLSAGSGNTTIEVDGEMVISDSIADNPDVNYYQAVYGSTVIVILSTSLIRGAIFMKASIHASTTLHDKVLKSVFQSPMTFFDTTPVGRILNIFSRDMDEIDVLLPINMDMFLQNIWLISCSLMLVCLVFWQFLPILLILSVVFMIIRNIFRIGIRDFKRLENVSRSPLYSHVSTTLSGLPTINAYDKQKMFSEKFHLLFDESSITFYLFNCAMRWLAIRLDMLALAVTACTAGLTVLMRGSVEAAFAGLALAYASQLSGIFQYTVRLSTETEARFTSVERINAYIEQLPSEDTNASTPPPSTWPQNGRISFRDVKMRYRENTPFIFTNLNFDIHENEKLGVVGRTGSGKSSLTTCLFRLVELSAGTIRIDGTDISKIPLKSLRSKLSIIPQDPVLFKGTIRYNLDPFNEHEDSALWEALDRIQLKSKVSAMSMGLLAKVAESGDNFSVGERQLMCMARALLRNSKILVLDEATANIDTESDAIIQRALQIAFKDCTIITIAHRINTIFWCNRVMVLENGTIMELDSPKNLMQDKSSYFAKMVAAASMEN